MKVINIGSLNIDHVYKVDRFMQPGETKAAASYTLHAGGKGLNQSIALASAGIGVYHAGILGNDTSLLTCALNSANVNTEYLQSANEACGHAIIQVDEQGQNCILLYGGTNRSLTKEYIDGILECANSDDVILIQNETNLVEYIISEAHSRGIRVAFNAAPMGEAVLSYPLEKLCWLIVNEVEGAMLAGTDEASGIISRLHAAYPQTCIVLTLGEEGVWYKDKSQEIRLGVCDIPEIVDTTAAGDTFIGYFLAGVLFGEGERTALIRATVASALAIGEAGASQSIPPAIEVDKQIAAGRLPKDK